MCHTGRKGTAEDLPFPNGSVDLITASSAAHYFDEPKFMAEANRVLKPGGCIALIEFCLQKTRLHHRDCGERLTDIIQEVSLKNLLFVDFSKTLFEKFRWKDLKVYSQSLLLGRKTASSHTHPSMLWRISTCLEFFKMHHKYATMDPPSHHWRFVWTNALIFVKMGVKSQEFSSTWVTESIDSQAQRQCLPPLFWSNMNSLNISIHLFPDGGGVDGRHVYPGG